MMKIRLLLYLKMTGKVMDYATEIVQGWEGMTNGMGLRANKQFPAYFIFEFHLLNKPVKNPVVTRGPCVLLVNDT